MGKESFAFFPEKGSLLSWTVYIKSRNSGQQKKKVYIPLLWPTSYHLLKNLKADKFSKLTNLNASCVIIEVPWQKSHFKEHS